MKKVLFNSSETKSIDQVADFLQSLSEKMKTGSITFSRGGQSTSLDIPNVVQLEINAEEKSKARGGKAKTSKRSLEISLEWEEGGEAAMETVLQ